MNQRHADCATIRAFHVRATFMREIFEALGQQAGLSGDRPVIASRERIEAAIVREVRLLLARVDRPLVDVAEEIRASGWNPATLLERAGIEVERIRLLPRGLFPFATVAAAVGGSMAAFCPRDCDPAEAWGDAEPANEEDGIMLLGPEHFPSCTRDGYGTGHREDDLPAAEAA